MLLIFLLSCSDEGRIAESRAGAARMQSLVTRRKLVDLAKLQSEEIKFLRDQVEQLRRRTFASFAIPQVQTNPDERVTAHTNQAGSAHYPPVRGAASPSTASRTAQLQAQAAAGRVPTSLPPVRAASAGKS